MSETSLGGDDGAGVIGRGGGARITGVVKCAFVACGGGNEGEIGEQADEVDASDETEDDREGVPTLFDEEEEVEAFLTDPTSTWLRHREPFFEPVDPAELTDSPSRALLLATARSRASLAWRSFSRRTSSRSTRR